MKPIRSAAHVSKAGPLAMLMLVWLVTPSLVMSDQPDVKAIGGRWFVANDRPDVYLFQDARPIDLFSYHRRDSNKDGIQNVRLSHDRRFLIVHSQGYPNHPTAIFPNSHNPNSIRVQNFVFRLPLKPQRGRTITQLPMGPIGVALNGVVFFNPFERGGLNAVAGYSEEWLDSCCGHPQQTGVYHYHKYPACVKSPFADDGKQHSPVIGFAFDGFAIYGPYEKEGTMARDLQGEQALDVCNGHSDPVRGYHYHVTPGRFPYIIGGYAGVPEASNNRQISMKRTGEITDNASGKSDRIGHAITSVKPATAVRGKQLTIRIALNGHGGQQGRLPTDAPSWVQIGPFEATEISRQGDTVIGVITIPEDAAVGIPLDCHVEFKAESERGRTVVFKKNGVFQVTQ